MPGRNDPCPCGSGKKYKRCCGGTDSSPKGAAVAIDNLVRRALQYQQSGQLDSAESLYRGALTVEPANPWLRNLLGTTLLLKGMNKEATACFRKAIELMGWEAQFHMNLGIALVETKEDESAIECFKRAVMLKPGYADAHYNLAKALNTRQLYKEAEASYQQALRLAPMDLSIHVNYALALGEQGKFAEALQALQHAQQLFPDNARVCSSIGELLKNKGDFSGAFEWFERALAISPTSTNGFAGLVECRKFTEEERPIVVRMENLSRTSALSDKERMDMEFALGKAYNDLGDYGEAFQHWTQGQALRGKTESFDHEAYGRLIEEKINRFSLEYFRTHAGLGSDSELPILIVGMPRSGTTLVEQIISSHPEVFGAGELVFWGKNHHRVNLGAPDTLGITELRDEYLALLRSFSESARRVTDKMPHNFLHLGIVHLLFPKARIIHCQRNPVDTCISIFSKNFSDHHPYAHSLENLAFYYDRYRHLMDHWRRVLPKEVFLEVPYEELVEDQETWSRRLIAHCGLEWDERCLAFHETARKVNTPSKWQVRQKIYKTSRERWRNYAPWIKPLLPLLDETNAREE